MRALREKILADEAVDERRPIQFLTERGFEIVRRCDLDGSDPANATEYCFLVKDMDGYELNITVKFGSTTTRELIARSHKHLSQRSSFWIAVAERHLADYLDRNEDFPPDATVNITEANLEDIDLALRWTADDTPDK